MSAPPPPFGTVESNEATLAFTIYASVTFGLVLAYTGLELWVGLFRACTGERLTEGEEKLLAKITEREEERKETNWKGSFENAVNVAFESENTAATSRHVSRGDISPFSGDSFDVEERPTME
jgi:hypothetical protein